MVAQHAVPIYNNSTDNVYETLEISQIDSLYELYAHNIDPSYELINGRAYFPYYFRSSSQPILFSEKNYSSSVTLKGIRYEDVALEFDTYTDEVIYIDSTRFCIYSPLKVALKKDNVDGFEFYIDTDTMSFRYFSQDTDPLFDLKDGYYEVVLERGSKYLIKHYSILMEMPESDEYNYTHDDFVNIGNGFSKISTKRQFIKIFGERSGEMRKQIEGSGTKIRKANKEQIMFVLKYYDSNRE